MYHFGFNGQEMDNEVSGTGNSLTAEFWQYDSRLGRRWNIDPVVKQWESPYACFSGNPIINADPNGDDDDVVVTGPEADEATKQADNASSLNITRDSQTGKLDATGTPTTESDVLLLKAIKDPTVTSEIYASQNQKTTSNAMFAGGAFMGTTVTTTNVPTPAGLNGGTIDIPVNTVVSNQEVNVNDCQKIDNYYGKVVGTTMIHEITESYVAGTISKASGVSSPAADSPMSIYNAAHNAATPEAGGVRRITEAKAAGFPFDNYIYLGGGPDENNPEQKIKVDVILRAY